MNNRAHRHGGFTLIELITVVVVLSLLAVVGTGFIVSATDSYQKTQTRSLLVNTGRQALEQMTRQLRLALPYSVRVTNDNRCVQFMPISGGGFYRGQVPDAANGAAAHTSITTTPQDPPFGEAAHLSIGAMDSDELYGAGAVSRAQIISRNATDVTFFSRTWQRNSLSQRFYLLGEPDAFCLFGDQLRYYPAQSVNDEVTTTSPHDLLARNALAVGTPFILSGASENRNVILGMNIGFTEGGETITFEQEVLIRNVP